MILPPTLSLFSFLLKQGLFTFSNTTSSSVGVGIGGYFMEFFGNYWIVDFVYCLNISVFLFSCGLNSEVHV